MASTISRICLSTLSKQTDMYFAAGMTILTDGFIPASYSEPNMINEQRPLYKDLVTKRRISLLPRKPPLYKRIRRILSVTSNFNVIIDFKTCGDRA